MEPVLDQLVEYAKVHFAEEEKYFERFGYADAENHIKMHRAYAEKVNELHADVLKGADGTAEKLFEFVRGWAVNHIMKADKLYSEALKGLN